MKKIMCLSIFATLCSTFVWGADAGKVLDASAHVLQAMTSSSKIPSSLLAQAKCIAVVPKMTKAGFMIGGKHGNGVVACRTDSGWSAPAFISITGGSVGFQAGAEQQDLVLLLNAQGSQELKQGHWDLGAEAVAAGPTGETGSTATTGWKAPVLSYSDSSGAFAGADIGGSKLGSDNDLIHSTYGESASLQTILDGGVEAPASAQSFLSELKAVGK